MSITKKAAVYAVKNEAKTEALLDLLATYSLLDTVKTTLPTATDRAAAVLSDTQETVVITATEMPEGSIAVIMNKHGITTAHPKVIIDSSLVDGYVIYHNGTKITVTASDRINRFVNNK